MTDTKFTPGPWRLWRPDDEKYPEPNDGDIRIVGANEICVGILFGGWSSIPELERNHHLIAAAPELYEALDELTSQAAELIERCDVVFEAETDALRAAHAALKKARGD